MTTRPVCIVAGVGPGIGLAVARRFAREGYSVALLARRQQALDAFVKQIAASGGTARAYAVDLADAGSILSTCARIGAELGAASVVIYNAAGWTEAHPMAIEPASFGRDLTLCATGALAFAQAAYPAMKAAGSGSMLFTGGGFALHPESGSNLISLVAGKSALRGTVLALAPSLAQEGIHVAIVSVAGAVAPGTAFDPDVIADRYWLLHRQSRSDWQTEILFSGA
jgi:NAD(P)-dependent dehydrogenase (short-subunit alcohol dehydrogenase family)